MTGKEPGFLYVGGLDLGLRRDASAFIVLAVPQAVAVARFVWPTQNCGDRFLVRRSTSSKLRDTSRALMKYSVWNSLPTIPGKPNTYRRLSKPAESTAAETNDEYTAANPG